MTVHDLARATWHCLGSTWTCPMPLIMAHVHMILQLEVVMRISEVKVQV